MSGNNRGRRPPRIVIEPPPAPRRQPESPPEDKAAERQHKFAIVQAVLRQRLSEAIGLIDIGDIVSARAKLDALVQAIDTVEAMDDPD